MGTREKKVATHEAALEQRRERKSKTARQSKSFDRPIGSPFPRTFPLFLFSFTFLLQLNNKASTDSCLSLSLVFISLVQQLRHRCAYVCSVLSPELSHSFFPVLFLHVCYGITLASPIQSHDPQEQQFSFAIECSQRGFYFLSPPARSFHSCRPNKKALFTLLCTLVVELIRQLTTLKITPHERKQQHGPLLVDERIWLPEPIPGTDSFG